MLGGTPTAQSAGLVLEHRDVLYSRMCEYPDAGLFRAEDIIRGDKQMTDDFSALRGHDYVHVNDGWLTRIVETKYLRRLPSIKDIVASYAGMTGAALVETGDWVAWRLGIREWEPLAGPRYYTDGAEALLCLNRIRIRLIPAPGWLREEDPDSRLLRAFLDTEPKELNLAMARARTHARLEISDLARISAAARTIALAPSLAPPPEDTAQHPLELADAIDAKLESWNRDR